MRLMNDARVYFDHNAAAPLLPEARAAVIAALELTGNPSSVHADGRALRNVVEAARKSVAALAGAERGQVVFTGSATEALTQAIVGGVKMFGIDGVVVSAGEHAATLRAAESCGVPVITVGLDGNGLIRVDEIASALVKADARGERLLVAVHWVNNETGVVQPMAAINALVGPTPHVLVVDAVQALGKLPLEFATSAPDMMAVSGHKIGAPSGVGALLVKGHADTVRLIPGGGQELGRRGGTEATALIAGFGAAASAFGLHYDRNAIAALSGLSEARLTAIAPDAVVFGAGAERIGNTVNFAVPGVSSAAAMMGFDLAGISVSAGSACSSGKIGRSHVLAAMGVDPELAGSALRLSLGWSSTAAQIDRFAAVLGQIVERHRARQHRAA